MDVQTLLELEKQKQKSTDVIKDIAVDVDIGLLCSTDLNPVVTEVYNRDLDAHLQTLARDGAQVLINSLFGLPIRHSPDGPLAVLPEPNASIPRSKVLPQQRAATKWERFANAKGIQHRKRDNIAWDEEKQSWVKRWGKDARNKSVEDQWLTEIPANADVEFDGRAQARNERKERVSKNEKQRQKNLNLKSHPTPQRQENLNNIRKTLSVTRTSTASMGKFDKKLDGEKKLSGVKRKFENNERSSAAERQQSMDMISSLSKFTGAKKARGDASASDLNVRKAVRFATKDKTSRASIKPDRKGTGNKREKRR